CRSGALDVVRDALGVAGAHGRGPLACGPWPARGTRSAWLAAGPRAGFAWLVAGRHAGCRSGGRVSRGLGWIVARPEQGVGHGFLQRVPGGGDDVLIHADG